MVVRQADQVLDRDLGVELPADDLRVRQPEPERDDGSHVAEDCVPINLPAGHKDGALHLRNKLLLFRFRNLQRRRASEDLVDRAIEPRLNQIFVPLLCIIEDPEARADLRELARRYNREIIAERGMDTEAQVLEIIRDMLASPFETRLSVKDITSWFVER